MSERESGGFGAFLLGIAVGAVAGFLFAPAAGDDTRRKLSKRLKNLRDAAEEKADEVRTLLEAGEDEAGEPAGPDEEDAPRSTREELERRLQAARRRRRRGSPERTGEVEEEDEPVA
ncbi:MAG: YtxH domain-containing protein [Gemmatimonadales bacterium]